MTSDDASLPEIRIRPEAEAEISKAFHWYEDKNEGLGSEFMRALDASLSYIQRNPAACATVHKQMRLTAPLSLQHNLLGWGRQDYCAGVFSCHPRPHAMEETDLILTNLDCK